MFLKYSQEHSAGVTIYIKGQIHRPWFALYLQPPVLEVTLPPVNSVSTVKFPSDSYPGTALTPTRAAVVGAADSACFPAAL